MQPFPRQALVTGIKPFNYVHDWRTTEHRMCKREGSQPMELPIAAWNSELSRIVHLINPTTKCGTKDVSFAGHAELECMELQIQCQSLPEHYNFFAIDSVVRLVLLVNGDGYAVTACPAAGLDSLTLPA